MANATDLHPFDVHVPEADLAELRDRLRRTRWPAAGPADDWSRGVPLDYLVRLTRYWGEEFDWRAQEEKLNAHPQFVTAIDGQTIHFIHVRSPERDALPLLLTHGWPSSAFEFTDVIGPLADPAAHGGSPADAFHVVIPCLPGYGFSTPVEEPGWGNLFRVAQAWVELMTRLGYERYAVHGTDAGTGVAGILAMLVADSVAGVHLTGTAAAMPFGPPLELDGLTGADRARAERFNVFQADGIGYLHLQATRPQTLAYLLNDSPAGQLAWIVEKFKEWTDPAAELPEDAVDRDHLLTNASIHWFTGAGASSAHAVYDGMQAWRQMAGREAADSGGHSAPDTGPPTGVAVFAADTTVRSVMDPSGRIDHWSNFERGGHFPALEVPELLVGDIRSFFAELRPGLDVGMANG